MDSRDFPVPPPPPPQRDLRALALAFPALASALGFFCFGVLGLAFTELADLPREFRTAMVIAGAFTLMAGGELGTLPTVVEIYRKWANGEWTRWDRVALVCSGAATVTTFVLAFAALLGTRARWSAGVREWGAIAAGVIGALDAYATFAELGMYLASYDDRLTRWRTDRDDWVFREQGRAQAAPVATAPQPQQQQAQEPPQVAPRKAEKDDWRRILAGMNGNRANITADDVERAVRDAGLAPRKRRTMLQWAQETREGKM